jgi:uncharacterized repeat protein (TIGR01451 family)
MKIWQKTIAAVATFALLLNSLAAPLTVLAQTTDESPTPSPEASVQPTDEATPTENPTTTPEVTIEATATPEATPDVTPTEIATPLASPESLTEAGTPTPTDAVVETQAPESNPTTQGPPASVDPSAEPSVTPSTTPTFTPEALPENATVTTTVVSTDIFPETVQNDLFKLITDKLDYSPSEIAIITGSSFTPNKTYSLTVASTDDPATSTTIDVTANGNGSFTYNYQLDGNYRPNYSVEVKDGEVLVASTNFTDSPIPPCVGSIGTTLLDTTQNITNDVDSGNFGNWALDAYARHIQVWLDGTTYCAQVDYNGTFHAPAGVLSPQNGTLITQNIDGTMIGSYRASIVGTPINFTSVPINVDYQGVISTGATLGYISWLDVTFNPGYVFHYLNSDKDWSWTYSTLHSGSWTNAGTGSSGDIIDATPSAITDPASSITSTDATLNGTNGPVDATGHSFWVSLAPFVTTSPTIPAGVYSTPVLGAISANANFSASLLSITTTGVPTNLPAVTPGTPYYFVAWSEVGGTWYPGTIQTFTTTPLDTTAPAVPTLLSPADGIHRHTSDSNFSDWSDVTDPSGVIYRYQSASDTGFTSLYYDSNSYGPLTESKIMNPGEPEVSYYWRVQACDTVGNCSAWTSPWKINIDNTAPTAPVNGAPNAIVIHTNIFDFTWDASSDASPVTYEYQASLNPTQTGGVLTTGLWHSGILPSNMIHSSGAPDGDWYWQVRAIDAAGNTSAWSAIWDVTLDTTGTIKVVKDVVPDDSNATGWDFAIAGATNNTASNIHDGGQSSVYTSNAGSYTITETGHSGTTASNYTTTYSCINSTAPITSGSGTVASFTLSANQNIVCTFTNTLKTATLKLVKVVDYGPAQPGDWTLIASGTTNGFSDYGNSTTFHTVNANTSYALSESSISGWSQYGNWHCDGGTLNGSTLTLSAGQEVTCTITNHRDMGSIKVNKYTDLNGDGDWNDNHETSNSNANSLGFQWLIDGVPYNFGATANNQATNLPNYYHTVDESSPTGYHFVGWYINGGRGSCTHPDGTTLPLVPTITKNHTTEITLCNAHDTGRITFTKVVFDGTSHPNDWTFNISGDGTAKNGDTKSIKTGTYTITESGPSGYFVSSVSGTACRLGTDNHTINLTVTKDGGTCIIANQKLASIKIIKDANPDSDQHFNFTTTGSGLSNFSLVDDHGTNYKTFSNLYSDEYTITEQPTTGWDLSSISCTDGEGSGITIDGNTLSIDLGTGKDVVCTFHNTQRGSIEGYKWNDLNGDGIKNEKHLTCSPWWNIFNCHWDGTDEPTLSGWTITLQAYNPDGSLNPDVLSTTTDNNGNYNFENVIPGTYKVCEVQHDGWIMTYPNHGNENLCKTITVGAGQNVDDFNFGNQLNTGTVTVTKFDDANQNGTKDEGESTLSGWTINLGRSSQTTGDDGTTTFTNVISDTYELSENLQEGYVQTNIYCNGGGKLGSQTNEGYYVNVLPGANVQCYIGNFEEQPSVSISKTNDKPDGISAGQTVDYSLIFTNTGNIPVTNITIQDALPGGFTYVAGSTTGATTTDPSISGSVLSWTGLGTLAAGESITIHYQASTASDLVNGIYTNFATCEVSKDFSGYKRELDSVDESLHCNPASSTVSIGNGVSYGGNLNTTGQVLGASTELPGTGSPTVLLIIALGALGAGLFLRGYNIKIMKKAKKAKGKTKKHAKK